MYTCLLAVSALALGLLSAPRPALATSFGFGFIRNIFRSLQMRVSTTSMVLVGLLPILSGTAARAITVTNPSFEAVQIGSPFSSTNSADIPGWTHSGAPGDGLLWAIGYSDSLGSVTIAGDGNQFVTMGGGFQAFGTASWSQTIGGFTPSQSYTLSFMMASETTSFQSLTVSFPAGSSTASQLFIAASSSANYWRNWESKSIDFVATSSTVTIEFSATTQYDVGLDNVAILIDTDGDGIPDMSDNCPFTPNGPNLGTCLGNFPQGQALCHANSDCTSGMCSLNQEDTGGVGVGSLPDGIGDACQCGDVNNDGLVTSVVRAPLVLVLDGEGSV